MALLHPPKPIVVELLGERQPMSEQEQSVGHEMRRVELTCQVAARYALQRLCYAPEARGAYAVLYLLSTLQIGRAVALLDSLQVFGHT